ncbi:hypothetical protein [Lactobacillus sp. HT06-2]|uniref:hypothetical protein n=1 Tax=Lactobacillus sp. HT06-2 TaxID=2080222 RepID=UPI001F42624E|nr:hypothetical protein [Lactobacillus sp. HT06-2]
MSSFEDITHTLDHISKEMDYLSHHQVVIGFFGAEDSLLLTVVRANEYGAHIVPKKGKFLWVPSRQAIKEFGKSVKTKDVAAKYNLFVPKGKRVACVNKNKKLVVYFYLLRKVDIPARAFIRKTGLDYSAKYKRIMRAGVDAIMYDNATGKQLLAKLGKEGVKDMREVMLRWTKPGNAPLTIENKRGANNPLVDTGQLQKHITWQILPLGGD